jgi:hypothetical protein
MMAMETELSNIRGLNEGMWSEGTSLETVKDM